VSTVCQKECSNLAIDGMVWNRQADDSKSHGRASYPKYDLEYLANALTDTTGTKYTNTLEGAERLVYAQKAASNYQREADNSLRSEFSSWLQGMHADNKDKNVYNNNRPGVTKRRHFMNGAVGPKTGGSRHGGGKRN